MTIACVTMDFPKGNTRYTIQINDSAQLCNWERYTIKTLIWDIQVNSNGLKCFTGKLLDSVVF